MLIIIGDWNAKVESKAESNIRKVELGVRNEAKDLFMNFCEANNLFITNTFFKQLNRSLITWTSPDSQYRKQMDYVIGRGDKEAVFSPTKQDQ